MVGSFRELRGWCCRYLYYLYCFFPASQVAACDTPRRMKAMTPLWNPPMSACRFRCRSRTVSPFSDVCCKYSAVVSSSTCSNGLPDTQKIVFLLLSVRVKLFFEILGDCVSLALFRIVVQWGVLGRSYGLKIWVDPLVEGVCVSGETFVGSCLSSMGWGPGWRKISSDIGDTLCKFLSC